MYNGHHKSPFIILSSAKPATEEEEERRKSMPDVDRLFVASAQL
jgi:hypothetical protein